MLVKISVVSGENFGTTNIYIRVKQQRHKEKKVFTDKFLIRYTHKAFTHTHTNRSLTVALPVQSSTFGYCSVGTKNGPFDKNNNNII